MEKAKTTMSPSSPEMHQTGASSLREDTEATPLMRPSFSFGESSANNPPVASLYFDAQEESAGDESSCKESDGLSGRTENIKDSGPLQSRMLRMPRNDNHEELIDSKADLQQARRLLYVFHLFAQASEISWQFCQVLFLSAFTNYESFALVSTYGIVSGLAVCFGGGRVGKFVDDAPRLSTARVFIWTENCAVLLAVICCYFLLPSTGNLTEGERRIAHMNEAKESSHLNWIQSRMNGLDLSTKTISLLLGLHVLGSFANLLDRGFTVAIERDWVVVMSQQVEVSCCTPTAVNDKCDDTHDAAIGEKQNDVSQKAKEKWLSQTNVMMRQIDLSCKVAAPTLTIYIVAAFGENETDLRAACVFVGVLKVLSLLVEYICIERIYRLVPPLGTKEFLDCSGDDASEDSRINVGTSGDEDDTLEAAGDLAHDDFAEQPDVHLTERSRNSQMSLESTNRAPACQVWPPKRRSRQRKPRCCIPFAAGWLLYLNQEVAPAGLALAFLHVNIISFGGIMTSYLVWRKMRMDAIGFWRGVSSATGLFGTVCYQKSVDMLGLSIETTGEWSIVFQFSCLLLCYASVFVQESSDMWSLGLLIGGTCASRVGLWVFDISVTQLMQERVPPDVRGVVGGVQQSLHAMFGLAPFVLGLIFPSPRDFHYFIEVGCSGVGVALILFTFGIFLKQARKQEKGKG